MKTHQGTAVWYNVPLAIDHQHQLIVAHEVTNAVTDQDQLAAMAIGAKDMRGPDPIEALADRGYDNGDEVKKCVQEAIGP
jgi:macrodomain Ter protein organizer (MatP/YcbG family)